jgi:membrane protein
MEISGVRDQITTIIDTLIPYQEPANFIKEIIFSRIEEFRIFKTLSGSLGIIGLFFAASGLFSSIRTILNTVFQVTETKWFYINKIRDIGMVLLVTAFFLVSMAIIPGLDVIPSLFDKLPFTQFDAFDFLFTTFSTVIMSILSFLLIFIFFYLVYYMLPYGRQPVRVVILSAFWASFLWILAKELFGYYITHSALLTRVYGTYVFLVIVILWIYYSSLVLIIGAEIGQLYKEAKEKSNE